MGRAKESCYHYWHTYNCNLHLAPRRAFWLYYQAPEWSELRVPILAALSTQARIILPANRRAVTWRFAYHSLSLAMDPLQPHIRRLSYTCRVTNHTIVNLHSITMLYWLLDWPQYGLKFSWLSVSEMTDLANVNNPDSILILPARILCPTVCCGYDTQGASWVSEIRLLPHCLLRFGVLADSCFARSPFS